VTIDGKVVDANVIIILGADSHNLFIENEIVQPI